MPADIWKRTDGRFTVRVWCEDTYVKNGQRRKRPTPLYRVRYWFRGVAPSTQSAQSEAGAVERAEAIWNGYARGELETPAVIPDDLIEAAERWVSRPDIVDRTARSYEAVVRLLVDFLPEGVTLQQLTHSALKRWLATVDGDVTHNTYLRTIRAFIRWCVEQRWLREDITEGLKNRRVRHERRPWLPQSDWPELLEHCQPAHRIRAAFVLETGLRAKEVIMARWDWIIGEVGSKAISVPASKSAKDRAVPLSDRAVELLDEARAMWGGDGWLLSKGGLSYASQANLTARTHLAIARANAARQERDPNAELMTDIDFHGLRRSAGSNWLLHGVPLVYVSEWLGHRSIETTRKHYAGLTTAGSASQMALVNAARAGAVVPLKRPSTPHTHRIVAVPGNAKDE